MNLEVFSDNLQHRIIKIGKLKPEIQPVKGARRHYAGTLTSHGKVTISLVTLYNCFLTGEDFNKEAQEICAQ